MPITMLLMTYCSVAIVKSAVQYVCNNMHVWVYNVWYFVKQKGKNVFLFVT